MATFLADLEGVKLTEEQAQEINSGIQEVVLRALAGVDTGGDLKISRNLRDNPLTKLLPPDHTDGIWIQPIEE